jgi:hypothetical protein
MFKGWELIYMWTLPHDDWLLGIEYAPDNIGVKEPLEEGEEPEVNQYSIVSVGFLIIRFDILIPYN